MLLPLGNNLVGCKWIYKTKFTVDKHTEKHKSRLVAKLFSLLICHSNLGTKHKSHQRLITISHENGVIGLQNE